MSASVSRQAPAEDARDEGFTLVEVIAALAVLAVVSTAALYFFVGGTKAIAQQQRSQSAVTVANEAMEAAFGVDPLLTSGSNSLLAGRTSAAVSTAWSAASGYGLTGLATSYPAYDPSASAGSTPTIPITQTTTLDNVVYTVYTLVGTCYRYGAVNGTSAPCGLVTGQASDPGTAPTGAAKMQRVMVLVTWQGATSTCTGGACSYQAQSLVDPNSDIQWNSTTMPIAVDDDALAVPGQTINIDVLHNDIIGTVISNPIRDVSNLTGSGTEVVRSDGSIDFTAPVNAAGIMSFQYRLKDQSGHWSSFATVQVRVTPQASPDSATTMVGHPVTIAVGANDIGTVTSLTVQIAAAHGSAVTSGTSVVYTPAAGFIGTDSFEYSFVDPDGLPSTQAKVTVSVTDYAAPLVSDLTVQVPATRTGTVSAIDWLTLTGNPSDYLIKVLSFGGENGSTLGLDGSAVTPPKVGAALTFGQQGNLLSSQTISYQVLTPDKGKTSATKTITVQVVPTATADSFSVARRSTNNSLQIGANDAPNNFNGVVQLQLSDVSSPSCGSLSASQADLLNGIVRFNAPTNAKTCTFTYVIRGSASNHPELVSAPVTVTVKVN